MSATPAPARLPIFDTATSIALLWTRARGNLQPHERRWFAEGAANQVARDSRLLAVVLEGVAVLVGEDTESGALQSKADVEDLLLFAAGAARAMHGMAEIAQCAAAPEIVAVTQ